MVLRVSLLVSLLWSGAGCGVSVAPVDAGVLGPDPAEPGPCANVDAPAREQLRRAGRNLFLTVYLPRRDASKPCSAILHPVVLLAPDSLQDVRQYASYAEQLASHGLAALLVDYPDDPFAADHRELALDLHAVLDWAATASQDPIGAYHGRFDSQTSGAVGHGAGAAVALLASLDDARLLAVAALDPIDGNPHAATPDPRYPSLAPQRAASLRRPLLLLGETQSGFCDAEGCRACVPLDDNYQRFFAAATGSAIEVTFLGADHNAWLDEPACGFLCDACGGGIADAGTVRRLSRRYLTAFLRWQLLGATDGLPYLCTSSQGPLPGETARVRCRDNGKLVFPDAGVGDGGLGDAQGDARAPDATVDAGPSDVAPLH